MNSILKVQKTVIFFVLFLSIGFSGVDIVISHYLGKGKILPFIKTDSYLGKILSKKLSILKSFR